MGGIGYRCAAEFCQQKSDCATFRLSGPADAAPSYLWPLSCRGQFSRYRLLVICLHARLRSLSAVEVEQAEQWTSAQIRQTHQLACIHREALALDEARSHAGCNHAFEDMTQDLALAEAAQPIQGTGNR